MLNITDLTMPYSSVRLREAKLTPGSVVIFYNEQLMYLGPIHFEEHLFLNLETFSYKTLNKCMMVTPTGKHVVGVAIDRCENG